MVFNILGFIFISLFGSLFHFVYEWSGQKKFVGFFVAVNESIWEHLKLAFFPIFVWAIVGSFLELNNFAFGVFITLLTVLVVIPVIFYTYSHFAKKSILFIDISSFLIAIGLAMFFSFMIFSSVQFSTIFNVIGIVGTSFFALTFSIFTFFPPHNFFFLDPITKKYGFEK